MTPKMKISALLLSSLLVLASVVHAQTATNTTTQFYAQPSVLCVFPGDFDNVVGGGLSFGLAIAERHAAELEVIYFRTQANSNYWSPKITFVPVLATYKYRLPLSQKWSCYFGGSVGITSEEANRSYYGKKAHDTAVTVGGQVGFYYELTRNLSLDLGAKVLGLEETDLTTNGSMAMVGVGLNCRF